MDGLGYTSSMGHIKLLRGNMPILRLPFAPLPAILSAREERSVITHASSSMDDGTYLTGVLEGETRMGSLPRVAPEQLSAAVACSASENSTNAILVG